MLCFSTSTQPYDYEMNINICFPSANPSALHALTYIWEKQKWKTSLKSSYWASRKPSPWARVWFLKEIACQFWGRQKSQNWDSGTLTRSTSWQTVLPVGTEAPFGVSPAVLIRISKSGLRMWFCWPTGEKQCSVRPEQNATQWTKLLPVPFAGIATVD